MTRSLPLFACLVLCAAIPAAAQKMITLNPVTVAGELVQAGPRGVVVKGGDGKNWTVQLDSSTKVKIKGTAVPETLTPRVAVRFVASIDKKTGKAQDKLDKVTIFTPAQGIPSRTLGVELAKAGAEAGKGEEAGMGGPMIIPNMRPNPAPGPGQEKQADAGPTPDVIPGTGAEPPAAKPKRGGSGRGAAGKGPAASVPEVASYEVCAQVVSYHNHKLIVNGPNKYFKSKVTVELSDAAEIALDLSDLNIAKPGDQVSAKGYYITPGICQHTESVVITLTNPLGEKGGHSHKARPAAKGNETPAQRRPAAGKAEPDAAAPGDQNDPFPDAKPAGGEKTAGEADKPVINKDRPKDDNDPVMDDPNAKPSPAPQPKPDVAKPDETKPDEAKPDGTEKKPAPKNDEKDVFDK